MSEADTSYHRIPGKRPDPPTGCPIDRSFDPLSEAYLDDPYAQLALRRETTPIFFAEQLGYLVVTRMEDVVEVFLNPDLYGSDNVQDPVFPIGEEAGAVLAAADFNPIAVMSNRQPPDHGRIRQHTKPGFSNRRMKTLEPYIRRRSTELAEEMLSDDPPADFVRQFAHPLPGETIFRFIGFPESDDEQLKEWCSDRLAFSWGRPTSTEQVVIAEKMLSYWRYCREFVAAKHQSPDDDFTSELLAAHDADEEDLTYREVESIVYGLSFAGHEIVSHLLSNSLLCLLSRRPAWDELCADRSLIPNALEEVLRFESPQTSWRRVANVDTTLGDIEIPAGTNIFLSLGAANHQPDQFDDPDSFDIHRENARSHISFGKGIHFCLGARLAKFEATIMLEVLTEKIPSLRLTEGQDLTRFPNITFRGPKELRVAWEE